MNDMICSEILGENGPLASHLENYTPRKEQQLLSAAIEKAIAEKTILVAEAGTGTGKTFAYLIPAMMSHKKVVVSTGTKNLQDQLFHRDLPFLRKILALPIKVALLKGRSNYLCKYRIHTVSQEKGFVSKEVAAEIEEVRARAPRTHLGETSELNDIPEDSPVWPWVTSTVDNCLGKECDFYADCYLVKARKKALEADVVIVNHHLFFADLNLKQNDIGELLPKIDVFVLDEAHQLPDIASQFFGQRVTSRQINELLRDTKVEIAANAKDMEQANKAIDRIKTSLNDMRGAMGDAGLKSPWITVANKQSLQQAKQHVLDEFAFLKSILEEAKERSKGLESCWQRCVELEQKFILLTADTPVEQIHWYENFSHHFAIHFTPMNIAKEFRSHISLQHQSWIFTSATLAVGNNFEHYIERMGLTDAECLKLDSPFDYQHQSLLYVPRGLPDPNDKDYTAAMVRAILPVLTISEGRTFVLFTSHNALKNAAALMENKVDYPLLIQGTQPKNKLLEQYRQLGNAILLGTGSFWEGVDVRGEALSSVIIDKLPFTMPDDPIQKARAVCLRKKGKNPFFDQQLPDAAITLKQGAGRLIRDAQDYGVLVICDPRIIAREYGKTFLQCLPNMPRTRELQKVRVFFEQLKQAVAS